MKNFKAKQDKQIMDLTQDRTANHMTLQEIQNKTCLNVELYYFTPCFEFKD